MAAISEKKLFSLNKYAGFTLIELLLYIAVAVVVLMVIISFVSLLLESRVHQQAIMEVETQGRSAMEFITGRIRNSVSVTTPAAGSSVQLSLVMADPLKNPTVVQIAGGVLRVQEGAGIPVALTNNHIVVSNLSFQNASRPSTRGIIVVRFTLTYKDITGRREYNYQQAFMSSAALR